MDGKAVILAADTTKSDSSHRSLPLVPEFRKKILAIREEQEKNRLLCGKAYNNKDSGYIYTDVLGNRINPEYLTKAFPQWMEQNGFRRMRFHDLRHSCASLLLAVGVSLKQIQEWLGHSDFTITANTYAHLEYDSKRVAANAMSWIRDTSMAVSEEDNEKLSEQSDEKKLPAYSLE